MTDESTTKPHEELTEAILRLHAIAEDAERGLIFGAIVGAHAAAFGYTPRQLLATALDEMPSDEVWVSEMRGNAERKIRNARRLFVRGVIDFVPRRNQG